MPADPDRATALSARVAAVPVLPAGVRAAALLRRFLSGVEDRDLAARLEAILAQPKPRALLAGLLAHSPFLASLIALEPDRLEAALSAAPEAGFADLCAAARTQARSVEDEAELSLALRQFRRGAALVIALADIAGLWDARQVTAALTEAADLAIGESVDFLLREAARNGVYLPVDPDRPAHGSGFVVLAMGKHGAGELNYSSDVDLIVFFDPDKPRLKGGRDAQSFFIRLTQRLVKLLQERTPEGYVFRVDLRLRPDPSATAIAVSIPTALHYYETRGQTWERSAFIKARPCAGDLAAGAAFLAEISPFVWRKYLDYASVADIHAMKREIHAFRGHDAIAVEGHNVKLGRGGIREIEFFVQTQQLIAGGRNPPLRVRETLAGLDGLVAAGWVKAEVAAGLTRAYLFLRQVEHRLQMVADDQTHTLPDTEEGVERIARFLGFPGRAAFAERLIAELRVVEGAYARLFEEAPALAEVKGMLDLAADPPKPSTLAALADLGFREPVAAARVVLDWGRPRSGGLRAREAREKVFELGPALLDAFARAGDPDQALLAFDRLLVGHSQPVELLTLLRSHPALLSLLSEVLGSAPRLAELISRRAHVLDALLEPGFFGDLADAAGVARAVAERLDHARSWEDLLDRARIVGQERMFLIGVRVLAGALTPEAAGLAHAGLAEAFVRRLHAAAEKAIVEAHGRVPGMRTAVVALGKFGSREMAAGSDLDLVLLYDHDPDQNASDGPRPLVGGQYFARLTQRLISALVAPTSEGRLYDVDMRLRPSGRSGPVANHLDGFLAYQRAEAWTWEHMALTRARIVSATPGFEPAVEAAIGGILRTPRDPQRVRDDIVEMRRAIATEKPDDDPWDIKHAAGGLVDIEFIAQTLQLIHAAARPEILDANTAAAIDKAARAGLIAGDDAEALRRALHLQHALTQILRLGPAERFIAEKAGRGLRTLLARAGELPDVATLEAHLIETQRNVRRLFEVLVGPL